jgi:hypothetical protein
MSSRQYVLAKIDALSLKIEDSVAKGGDVTLNFVRSEGNTMFNVTTQRHEVVQESDDQLDGDDVALGVAAVATAVVPVTKHSHISLARHPKRFAEVCKALTVAYSLVLHDEFLTLRGLFYANKGVYSTQADSNAAVNVVCALLELSRCTSV